MSLDDITVTHEHCYHATTSPLMIVLKEGYIHQTCCKCPATRMVHRGHAGQERDGDVDRWPRGT